MTPYDFVHLALLGVGGEVRGKTKLQKTMYFLGLLTGQLDSLGYRAHFYGPYSEDVADAVATLESLGFVSSRLAGSGGVDAQGFEIRRTDYALTPEGSQIAQAKAVRHGEMYGRLARAAEALSQAGEQDYVRLSIAAKTLYMLREKNAPATRVELRELARRFGWNVSLEQIEEAAVYLGRLNLVETRAR